MSIERGGLTARPFPAGGLSAAAMQRTLGPSHLTLGGLDRLLALPDRSESPNLRRVLVDVIEEYARHTGHADLIRESIDGLVGEDPPD